MTSSPPVMSRWRTVLLLAIYACLTTTTNFPSGFTNTSVNTAVETLHGFISSSFAARGWAVSENTVALVQSATLNCWFVAQVFGAMFAPFFTDKYGRKVGYIIGISITLASSGVQLLAVKMHAPEILILGRSLTALMSPLCDASLILYLQETSPLEMRGSVSFFGEIGYGAMCVLGMVLGLPNVLGASLETLLMASLIPEVCSLVFLFIIPETPKYLMIIRKDRNAARASLEFFQGAKKDNERILDEFYREGATEEDEKRSSFKEVFSKWHLRQAVLLACCVLALTLSFYPILQSSTYFFLASDIPMELAEMSSTALMAVFTVASIMGTSIIDKYPRRFLIIFFGLLSNLFLLMFAVLSTLSHVHPYIKYACIASIVSYIVSFGLVLGPLSWFVAPELVSQRHRSSVFCICFAINNVLIAVTNFTTIPLFRLIGGLVFIPLFIVPSAICLIVIYLYLPETLGKEPHEIVNSMIRKRKREPDVESDIVNVRY